MSDSLVSVCDYYRKVDVSSLTQRRSLLSQEARKKLGKKAGSDYLDYLVDGPREDTFLMVMSFVNTKVTLIQRSNNLASENSECCVIVVYGCVISIRMTKIIQKVSDQRLL